MDETALRTLIAWQVESGIDFLVPCGTTGEAATMSAEEDARVIEITVEAVRHRVPATVVKTPFYNQKHKTAVPV